MTGVIDPANKVDERCASTWLDQQRGDDSHSSGRWAALLKGEAMCPHPASRGLHVQPQIIECEVEPRLGRTAPGLQGVVRACAPRDDEELAIQAEHLARGRPKKPLEEIDESPDHTGYLREARIGPDEAQERPADLKEIALNLRLGRDARHHRQPAFCGLPVRQC